MLRGTASRYRTTKIEGRARKLAVNRHTAAKTDSSADIPSPERDRAKDAPALVIIDNGKRLETSGEEGLGMGLRNMQYRADAIQAVLTIESKANRRTRIRCTIPSGRAKRSRPARSAPAKIIAATI